jgi:multidrug resistance efflux pump
VSAALPVIPIPRAQRLEALRRHALPTVVWLIAAVVAAILLANRTGSVHYPGMAHGVDCQIAPTVVGRVQTVIVALNDRVVAGQAVVLLDDSLLRASVEVANANLRKLRADLAASAASLATASGRVAADMLRLQMEEGGRRLDVQSLRARLESDTIEVERLALEAQRQEQMLRQGISSRAQFDNAKLARDALAAKTAETKALLAQTEREWEQAKVRRESVERTMPAGALQQAQLVPLQEAVAVEEAALQEIEVKRAALVLRSPIAGQVSQVWCTAGQSVKPGDPILTIVESAVRDLVVYVDETSARRIAPRQRVVVSRAVPPVVRAESVVMSVGETVQQLPPRFWRDPRVPSYGRTVVVAPSPALPLAVGELVDVWLPAFK